MTGLHLFDSHVAAANLWMKALIAHLGLAPEDDRRALHALRAGLHAIRDRLPTAEVVDLGAQLPTVIRGFYYEGWTLHPHTKRVRDREAMLARVEKELGPDVRLAPVAVLRAVIQLLVEHISAGEIRDILATLPKPLAALWNELAPRTGIAVQEVGRMS